MLNWDSTGLSFVNCQLVDKIVPQEESTSVILFATQSVYYHVDMIYMLPSLGVKTGSKRLGYTQSPKCPQTIPHARSNW